MLELIREAETVHIFGVLDLSMFSLAGNAYETVQELYNTYEALNTHICEIINATPEKSQKCVGYDECS